MSSFLNNVICSLANFFGKMRYIEPQPCGPKMSWPTQHFLRILNIYLFFIVQTFIINFPVCTLMVKFYFPGEPSLSIRTQGKFLFQILATYCGAVNSNQICRTLVDQQAPITIKNLVVWQTGVHQLDRCA